MTQGILPPRLVPVPPLEIPGLDSETGCRRWERRLPEAMAKGGDQPHVLQRPVAFTSCSWRLLWVVYYLGGDALSGHQGRMRRGLAERDNQAQRHVILRENTWVGFFSEWTQEGAPLLNCAMQRATDAL